MTRTNLLLAAITLSVLAAAASPATQKWSKLVTAGERALGNHEYDRAKRLFSTALETAGTNKLMRSVCLRRLGETLQRKGDFDAAVQLYSQDISSRPDGDGASIPSLFGIAETYGSLGERAKQEQALRKALSIYDAGMAPQDSTPDKIDVVLSLIELEIDCHHNKQAIELGRSLGVHLRGLPRKRKAQRVGYAVARLSGIRARQLALSQQDSAKAAANCLLSMVEEIAKQNAGTSPASKISADERREEWQTKLALTHALRDIDRPAYLNQLYAHAKTMIVELAPDDQLLMQALHEAVQELPKDKQFSRAAELVDLALVHTADQDSHRLAHARFLVKKCLIAEAASDSPAITRIVPDFQKSLTRITSPSQVKEISQDTYALASRVAVPIVIAVTTRELELAPQNVDPRLRRIKAYFSLGKLDAAKSDLDIACLQGSKAPEAFVLRGSYLWQTGHNDAAITDFSRAIKLGVRETGCYAGRGLAYLSKQHYAAAIADMKSALSLDKTNYNAHWGLGLAYTETNRLPEALAALNTAVSLHPEIAAIYPDRARCYMLLGQTTQAKADCNRALSLAGSDAEIRRRCDVALQAKKPRN